MLAANSASEENSVMDRNPIVSFSTTMNEVMLYRENRTLLLTVNFKLALYEDRGGSANTQSHRLLPRSDSDIFLGVTSLSGLWKPPSYYPFPRDLSTPD
jgi:hypothetical protein